MTVLKSRLYNIGFMSHVVGGSFPPGGDQSVEKFVHPDKGTDALAWDFVKKSGKSR